MLSMFFRLFGAFSGLRGIGHAQGSCIELIEESRVLCFQIDCMSIVFIQLFRQEGIYAHLDWTRRLVTLRWHSDTLARLWITHPQKKTLK